MYNQADTKATRMTQTETTRVDRNRERFAVEQIERMVHEFYGRVREEPTLGPIFAARITDWPHHLDRMVNFWRAVLRSEPTFTPSERGAPPMLHRQITELQIAHFDIWLGLFGVVVDGIFAPDEAILVKEAAQRIGYALSRHVQPDALSARGV